MRRGRQENADGTTTLWRPTGPNELEKVRAGGFQAWPPRLPDQPIFYPVLNAQYAATIARGWNVAASGSGYVTRFHVATPTARRYATQTAGGPDHLELWVPAEELDAFNAAIVGKIEVVEEFSV
ncbi:ADP-ribosylation/crystallin J1 [Catenulispora sp. GAS73]|uniref:ADP-ribosylation/crystallin J1 n=1 Tax=Catenulispora sp. GAS73 TaxID=3156269 RepID=UPI0035167676